MKKDPNSNSKDRISGDASDDEDFLNLKLFDNDQTSDFADLEEDILQLSKDSEPLSDGTGQSGASEDDVIDLFEEDNAIDDDDLIDLTKEFEEFLLEDSAEEENDEESNVISFPEEAVDDSAEDMDLLELTDEVDAMSAETKDASMLEGASGNLDEDDGLMDWANEISFSLDDNDEGPLSLTREVDAALGDEKEEPLELTDEVVTPLEDDEEPLELTDEVVTPLEDDEGPLELTDELEAALDEEEEELLELTGEVDSLLDLGEEESPGLAGEVGAPAGEAGGETEKSEGEDEEESMEQAVFAEDIVLDTEIVDSETSSEEIEVASTTSEIDGIDYPHEQEDDDLFHDGEAGEDLENLIEQANAGMDISGEMEDSGWEEEAVDEDEVIDLTEVAEVLIQQGLQAGHLADRADERKRRDSDASDAYEASPDGIVARLEDELPAAFMPAGTVEKEDGAIRGSEEAAAGPTVTDDAVERALENVIREMFAEKIERILVNAVKKVVEEDIERLKKQILDNIDDEPAE